MNSAALTAGTPDLPSPPSSSAMALFMGMSLSGSDSPNCSGVLVAPRLVLTAGHCAESFSRSISSSAQTRTVDAAGVVTTQTVRITEDGCHLHPRAIFDEIDCGFDAPVSANIQPQSDLALLELGGAITGVTPRPLGPPRTCLRTQGVPIVIRGFARASSVRGRLRQTTIARVVDGIGVEAGQAELVPELGVMNFPTEPGDSGGPYTEAAFEPDIGPVLAVTSKPFANSFLWSDANQAWLWSVIDPDDHCVIGSMTPCQPLGFDAPLSDADGDGLPNIRDLCPTVPVVRVCAGQHCDADGDFVGDECDDFDGVDNTTGAPNAESVICDHADEDGDGVPTIADNCPDHANRNQAVDCNTDAVAAINRARAGMIPPQPPLPIRGDACDQVPCGETQILEATQTLARTGTRFTMDRLEVDARANTPEPDSPRTLRTAMRFCQCRIGRFVDLLPPSPGPGIPAGDGIFDGFVESERMRDDEETRVLCERAPNGGCVLNELAAVADPRTTPRDEPDRWRLTTHERLDWALDGLVPCPRSRSDAGPPPGCVDVPPVDPPGFEYTTAYDRYAQGDTWDADRFNRWRLFEDDVPRWRRPRDDERRFRDDVPSGVGARGAVSGVFWTHTPGSSSATDPDFPFFGDLSVRQQASHYTSTRVLAPFLAPPSEPCFVPFLPFLGGDLICPFCSSSFPFPVIGFRALRGCLPSFELPALWLGNVRIDPSEALELAGLELFANDPGPYAAAAEVGSWLPQDGLRYVKLVGGAAVVRQIVENDGAFEEPAACTPEKCDPFPFPQSVLAAAVNAPGETPVPRRGHAEVLSARRGTVWVVGGEALSGGEALDELWAYELVPERWCRFGADGRPRFGRVLAATYSAAQDLLWVLDEVGPDRGPRERRLIRLDPARGVGIAVASWPARSGNDRFALAADAEGILWVVGWQERGDSHALVRLDWRPIEGLSPLGWTTGAGRVVGSTVRASERGLSFYALRGPRRVDAVGYRPDDLRRAPGGEQRCF